MAITVKVEILPKGRARGHYTTGELSIWNDETGTEESGNYCWVFEEHTKAGEIHQFALGYLQGWPRQAKSYWQLVHQVLTDALQTPNELKPPEPALLAETVTDEVIKPWR